MGIRGALNAFADWLDGTISDEEYRRHLGSARWQRTRAAVMAREAMAQGRAKPLCRRCGKNAGTDVHHRTYDRFGKEKLPHLDGDARLGTVHLHDTDELDVRRPVVAQGAWRRPVSSAVPCHRAVDAPRRS